MKSTAEVVRYYAERARDRSAVLGSNAKLTYRELLDTASVIAQRIVEQRMRVVALALDNGPTWIAADLGAQLAGVTIVPLPAFFSAEQARHVLGDAAADGMIVDTPFLRQRGADLELRAVASICADAHLVQVGGLQAVARIPPQIAKVSYTSGTTGQPKGVCLPQSSMDHVAQSVWSATAAATLERHLCLLPLATLLENVAGVYAPLRNGAQIIAPSLREVGFTGSTGIDARQFLACIHRYDPHSVILLPQTLLALVVALERGAPRPQSLRFAAVGGARVSPALLERAARLGLPVYEGYGLTECASVVALNTPNASRIGSVGRALPHARIRIDGGSQIHVGGAAACGYVGEPARACDEIATGDLGYLDDDGYLHVSGRRKNVFITSFGRNVSPDWVEAELVRAQPIAQAAVFGEARPWNVAVLVPAGGSAAHDDIQAIVEEINADLPDYARIADWIRADEPFTPANGLLTANGRNRRAAIWDRYRARIDASYDSALSDTA
jgi:long-subunit acyl-CoA synthetase (AMP-forming)